MANLDPLFKVIILDQDSLERRRLVGLLAQCELNLAVIEACGEREALEHLVKQDIAIVFLGAGYPHLTQQQILMRTAKTKLGQSCAFIAVTNNQDRESVLSLIRCGASGVLLPPRSALSRSRRLSIRRFGSCAKRIRNGPTRSTACHGFWKELPDALRVSRCK